MFVLENETETLRKSIRLQIGVNLSETAVTLKLTKRSNETVMT